MIGTTCLISTPGTSFTKPINRPTLSQLSGGLAVDSWSSDGSNCKRDFGCEARLRKSRALLISVRLQKLGTAQRVEW